MYSEDIAIESFIDFCDYMQIDEYEIAEEGFFKTAINKFVKFIKWIWEKITGLFKKNKKDIETLHEETSEMIKEEKQKSGTDSSSYVPSKEIGDKFKKNYKTVYSIISVSVDHLKKYENNKDPNPVDYLRLKTSNEIYITMAKDISRECKKLSEDKRFKDYQNPVQYVPISELEKENTDLFNSSKILKEAIDLLNENSDACKNDKCLKIIMDLCIASLSAVADLLVLTKMITGYTNEVNKQHV